MKQFFTTMPEPLIPFEETDGLVKAYNEHEDNPEALATALTNVLKRMPVLNVILLRFLVEFLSKIVIYSEITKMTADNLAICFGPNLIRFKNASAAMMASQIEAKVIAEMIKQYDAIFCGIGEV
jgi:hypothetical protein